MEKANTVWYAEAWSGTGVNAAHLNVAVGFKGGPQAWELIRPCGTVVVVGLSPRGSKVTLPAFDFISEKNIRGCFYGSLHFNADVPVILKRIQAGRVRFDGMVSHRVPLEELEAAFSRLRSGDGVRTILRF